jgi:mRNA interferase HigB
MRIIAPSTIRKWYEEHPRAKDGLLAWKEITEREQWKHPPDMLEDFPKTDPVEVKSGKPNVYVFNIRQNEYRLVCAIHFNRGMVFTLRFMTHKEYERGDWKKYL